MPMLSVKKLIEYLFNRAVWFMLSLPYLPMTLNSKRWVNKRSAANTIAVCDKIGLVPACVFDVGSNESQWTYWLKLKWSWLKIHSFEPQMGVRPMGEIHRIALSDENSVGRIKGAQTSAIIVDVDEGAGQGVIIQSFDEYFKGEVPENSILKIDAEAHTARALLGFGQRINEFKLVILEVCYDNWHGEVDFGGQQAIINRFMLDNGFDRAQVVDADYFNGHTNYCDIAFFKSGN